MNVKPRFLRIITLGLSSGIFICGCGQKDDQPPQYNQIRNQTVNDLFQSLEEDQPETALKQLNRIATYSQETEAVELLKVKEQNRLLVQQFNDQLEKGDLEAAEQLLEQHIKLHGNRPFHRKISRLIDELIEVKQYINLPAKDSQTMKEALNRLLEEVEIINELNIFQTWIAKQRSRISEIRQEEIRRAVQKNIGEIKNALRNNDPEMVTGKLNQLAKIKPEHPLLIMLNKLRNPAVPVFQDFLDILQKSETKKVDKIQYLEMTLTIGREKVSKNRNFARDALEYLHETEPALPSAGLTIRAHLAAVTGETETMLKYLEQLLEKDNNLDRKLLETIIKKYFLSPSLANAKPWASPFPSTTDIIKRILQTYEYHGTNTGSP